MSRRRSLSGILTRLVVAATMIGAAMMLAASGSSDEGYLERYQRLGTTFDKINRAIGSVRVP